jgi:hypothetical protein
MTDDYDRQPWRTKPTFRDAETLDDPSLHMPKLCFSQA